MRVQGGKDDKASAKAEDAKGKDAKGKGKEAPPQLPASVKTAPSVKSSPDKPDPKAAARQEALRKEVEKKNLEIQKQKCDSLHPRPQHSHCFYVHERFRGVLVSGPVIRLQFVASRDDVRTAP